MQNDSYDRSAGPSSFDDIAARIQSLRNILNSERHISAEQQVALEALDQEEAHRLSARAMERDASSIPNSLPRTYSDEGYWESQSGPNTTSIARERRRPPRPGVRMERQRERLSRLGRSEPLEQVDTSVARLPPLHTSRTRQASTDLDVEPQSIRGGRYRKRRKLNDGTADMAASVPNYGLTTLRSPCNLLMTFLESGIVNDLDNLRIHMPDNKIVLRTRSKQCSILMKHQGGWPFDLSKLLVKLSKHDYDVTQLQGMVFVAMNGEDLIAKTEYYDSLIPAHYTYHRIRSFVDTYRPTREASQRSRSPYRSIMRPRLAFEPDNAQWCDIRVSEDPAQIGHTEGHQVTVESVPGEEEEGSPTSPRSPQTWYDMDQEYSRRHYALRADSYRPNYDDEYSRAYYRTTATAGAHSRSSPTPSDSEDEELMYGRMASAQRELQEAEDRQQAVLDRLQSQRERRFVRPTRPARWTEDPEFATRDSQRAYRDHFVSGDNSLLDLSHQDHTSRKRLPGPSEMLQGRAAYSDAIEGASGKKLLPHAKFQVMRGSGGVTINFDPPM